MKTKEILSFCKSQVKSLGNDYGDLNFAYLLVNKKENKFIALYTGIDCWVSITESLLTTGTDWSFDLNSLLFWYLDNGYEIIKMENTSAFDINDMLGSDIGESFIITGLKKYVDYLDKHRIENYINTEDYEEFEW